MDTFVERSLAHEKARREGFERWYQTALHLGDLPIEFSGAQGKDLLEKAFTAGGACAMIDIAMTMIKGMAEKKEVGK